MPDTFAKHLHAESPSTSRDIFRIDAWADQNELTFSGDHARTRGGRSAPKLGKSRRAGTLVNLRPVDYPGKK